MRVPDLSGSDDIAAWRFRYNPTQNHVVAWLVRQPRANLLWDYWIVSCVRYDQMYEVLAFALDPEHAPPNPDKRPPKTESDICPLVPHDLCVRLTGLTSQDVEELVEGMVRLAMTNAVSFDSANQDYWQRIILCTVGHIAQERVVRPPPPTNGAIEVIDLTARDKEEESARSIASHDDLNHFAQLFNQKHGKA